MTIDRTNVERFQAIITSEAFQKYNQAHVELEHLDAEMGTVLTNIRNSGNVLIQKSKILLPLKPSVLHILPIVPKIVDTVFGKLPGTLAQLAVKEVQALIDQRKQILIYQFDHWLREYTAMQLKFVKSDLSLNSS